MKTIFIVRHAKSSWNHQVSDHKRPLSSRGLNDANLICDQLKGYFVPDLVLSSDATRAKTTAEIFVSRFNINQDIFKLKHELYDFSGEALIQTIKNCQDNINNLMVFGHNHAITYFVNSYGNIYVDNIPTCGVAVIKFPVTNWSDIDKGETIKLLFPKDLK